METPQTGCIACGRKNDEVPLIPVAFGERFYWICPQDFPVLIHQPEKLIGKLPGAEKLEGHEH